MYRVESVNYNLDFPLDLQNLQIETDLQIYFKKKRKILWILCLGEHFT